MAPGSSSRGSETALHIDKRAAPRPAFYALSPGGWRDLVTILHPPYTAWHLSYVAIGAALAPTFVLWRLGAALGAFFLALGVALPCAGRAGRAAAGNTAVPHGRWSGWRSLAWGVRVAIGIVGAVIVSWWLIPLVVLGAFLALAYNLELWGGRFHTDLWFAVAWGGFPAFTGWFVEALNVRIEGVLVALACCLIERCPAQALNPGPRAAPSNNLGDRPTGPARWRGA